MDKLIETAVIPAAGFGRRMGRLTTVIPKELFPLGEFPMIEHTITELQDSGIKGICIVIRKGKEMIEEYLTKQKFKGVEISFVYQTRPLGVGDALRKAKDFVGKGSFVMALPDQILLSKKPATQQLLDQHGKGRGIWNSMVRVPQKELCYFEGARPFRYRRTRDKVCILEGFSKNEHSLFRGFGRTVFLSEALAYMTQEYLNDHTGEVDLLHTYRAIQGRIPLYGTILKGIPCDLGTWEGYAYYLPIILRYMKREKGL